ncbi:MAG TPA: RHS repeat-associated core domain-containing protein [Chthoniobacterales bacterium]|nr:RHS repeat-associated core domain-containing protein [Chthoniobacterales bacterium]
MKTPFVYRLALSLSAVSFITFIGILRADEPDYGNPTGASGQFNGSVQTGCNYDPLTGNARRSLVDISVTGAVTPLAFIRTMNSRTNLGPATSALYYPFGKGGAWRHNYQWEVTSPATQVIGDDPCYVMPPSSYTVTYPDGRKVTFHADGSSATTGIGDRMSGLEFPEADVVTCSLILSDGSRIKFNVTTHNSPPAPLCIPVGNTIYHTGYTYAVTGIINPYGQETTIAWNNGKIDTITEPAGRSLKLYYNSDSTIDRVEEWARSLPTVIVGRTVQYHYSSFNDGTTVLDNVVYFGDSSLTAKYTYQASNEIFANPPKPPLIRSCDDPIYSGAMNRIVYDFASDRPHGFIESERYFDGNYPVNPGPKVSSLAIDPANSNKRIETRGDGPSRTFTYQGGLLKSWTDFKATPNTNTFSQEHFTSGATGFIRYVKDARQNQTDFVRDSVTGHMTEVTFPLTPSDDNANGSPPVPKKQIIEYDSNPGGYYVMSTTNEREKQTFYRRDTSSRRVSDIDYPDGGHEGFQYNGFGQVTRYERKNGYFEHVRYDPRGLLEHRSAPTANGTMELTVGAPQTTLTYYPLGDPWQDRLKSVTDLRQKTTIYEYERSNGTAIAGRGLISKIIHPDNSYVSFGYDSRGNKLWQENELRQRTSFSYDAYNRLITVTLPLPNNRSGVMSYEYDPSANVHVPTSPSYRHTSSAVSKITSAEGIMTTHRYDENFRRIETTEGAGSSDAATTHYDFDPVGNLEFVTDPRTYQTHLEYDQRNRRKKVTSPEVTTESGPARYITEWFYDPVGNVRDILQADQTKIHREYDAMNRLWTHDLISQDGQRHRISTFQYFPSGRVWKVKDPKDQTTEFGYDGRDLKSLMKYPNGAILQGWEYDGNENMTKRPTIGLPTQTFTYDDRNRLEHMRWSNGVDFSDFGYNDASQLTWAVNPNSTITRDYDQRSGRMNWERQVLAATSNPAAITIAPIAIASRKAHGDAGAFDIALPLTGDPGIECRNGPAYTIVLTFAESVTVGGASVNSGIGSVANTSANGNTVTVNLTDVSNAQVLTVKVFGLSNGTTTGELIVPMHILTGDITGDGAINKDDVLQVEEQENQHIESSNFRSDVNTDGVINGDDVNDVSETSGEDEQAVAAAGPQATVEYRYDDDGRPKNLSVLPIYSYDYTYDGLGRLEWITEPNVTPGNEGSYKYSYDPASNVTARVNYTNGTTLSFAPDELNRPTQEAILSGNDTLSHLHHGYDSMGRLSYTYREEEPGLVDTFVYDFTGELTLPQYGLHVNEHGEIESPQTVPTFVYDFAGNRLSEQGAPYVLNPQPLNQYIQTPGGAVSNGPQHEIISYDNAGYAYRGDTRLAVVAAPVSAGGDLYQLGYDALGRTVKRKMNQGPNQDTKYFIYDGARSIIEYDGAGIVRGRSLYGLGLDEIIARDNNGQPQFPIQDRLGSTIAVTGANGRLLEKYWYEAFGTPHFISFDKEGNPFDVAATHINNNILFAGREWVSRFGFYENRARAYHPGLGRFMSEDPSGFDGGDTNLYRYCGNDPVNFYDDSGLQPIPAGPVGPAPLLFPGRGPVTNWPNTRPQLDQNGIRNTMQPDGSMIYYNAALVETILRNLGIELREGLEFFGPKYKYRGDVNAGGPNVNMSFLTRLSSVAPMHTVPSLEVGIAEAISTVSAYALDRGPGIGEIAVNGRVILRWHLGDSFAFRGTLYFHGIPIRGLGSALISTGGGGWEEINPGWASFPGPEAGEGFHPPAEP